MPPLRRAITELNNRDDPNCNTGKLSVDTTSAQPQRSYQFDIVRCVREVTPKAQLPQFAVGIVQVRHLQVESWTQRCRCGRPRVATGVRITSFDFGHPQNVTRLRRLCLLAWLTLLAL